ILMNGREGSPRVSFYTLPSVYVIPYLLFTLYLIVCLPCALPKVIVYLFPYCLTGPVSQPAAGSKRSMLRVSKLEGKPGLRRSLPSPCLALAIYALDLI